MHYERIQVKCSSSALVIERPHKGRQHRVAEIVDRWYEGGCSPGRPAMYYVKVRTANGEEFILRYNTLFDAWAILIGGQGDS